MTNVQQFAGQIMDNVEHVIIGKRDVLELLLVAVLCEGHVLMEDVTGHRQDDTGPLTGSQSGAGFQAAECTRFAALAMQQGVSILIKQPSRLPLIWPSIHQYPLADEINAGPRPEPNRPCWKRWANDRSSDGITRPLERPFCPSDSKPVEYETFPLPEAQLDRFFMKLSLGYLDEKSESQMLLNLGGKSSG
ncbi:MAG: hypothetical protein R3C44_05545 [Chloroflexota bacterium]